MKPYVWRQAKRFPRSESSTSAPSVRGFSLIEVVASLMLMGILMTSALMAYGSHAAQIRKANDRLAAIDACDALISDWMQRPSAFEGHTSGILNRPQQQYRWRRFVLNSHAANRFDAQVVRWEMYQQPRNKHSEPIVTLDVLVAKPKPPKEGNREN